MDHDPHVLDSLVKKGFFCILPLFFSGKFPCFPCSRSGNLWLKVSSCSFSKIREDAPR